MIGTNEFGWRYAQAFMWTLLGAAVVVALAAWSESKTKKRLSASIHDKAATFLEVVRANSKPIHDRLCPDVELRKP
jgi:hypothetical protein